MDGPLVVQEPMKGADLYRKLAAEHSDLVQTPLPPSFASIISASRRGTSCTRRMHSDWSHPINTDGREGCRVFWA